LLVLGVVALLLVAAFVVYPQVRLAQRVSTEVQNLNAVQSNLKALYSTRNGNYAGLTVDVARNARIFPSRMVENNDVVNAWGGKVLLGPAANPYSGMAAGRTYVIRYRNVPSDACVALISQSAGYFYAIAVGTESNASGGYSKIVHVMTDTSSPGYNNGAKTGLQVESMVAECSSRAASEILFISS